MRTTQIRTAHLSGIQAVPALVTATEAQIGGIQIEGVSEAAARELRVRVRAAAVSQDIMLPLNARVVVSDPNGRVFKAHPRASAFDLPVALALWAIESGKKIPDAAYAFGELSLGGEVRRSYGAELVAELAGGALVGRCEGVFVPPYVLAVSLGDAVHQIQNFETAVREPDTFGDKRPPLASDEELDRERLPSNFATGLWAATVAATGGLGLLLIGAPGSGKTMLARRIPRLLPELHEDADATERKQLRRIWSATGYASNGSRPFRAPHHTASTAAIHGGGLPLRPGERTLAHGGVLFLDELPEFTRDALGRFSEPPRDGMPSEGMLVGAMNPCPCGRLGWPVGRGQPCTCKPMQIQAWNDRVAAFRKQHFPVVAEMSSLATPTGELCTRTIGELRRVVVLARRKLTEDGVDRQRTLSFLERVTAAVEAANDELFPKTGA